jgi:hypothetical protein
VTKTLDDNSVASFPGRVRLSKAKLKALQPELFSRFWDLLSWQVVDGKLWNVNRWWKTRIEEHLWSGDSRAAVVVSTKPLLVAAYTDEIDCVALLRFRNRLVSEYDLEVGSRLVTVNLYEYMQEGTYETDLLPGPRARVSYRNFTPLIADFLTDDFEQLAKRKDQISEDEWKRTEEMGQLYLEEAFAQPRDGRPFWCSYPADSIEIPPESRLGAKREVPSQPVSMLEAPKRILFVIVFTSLTIWSVKEALANSRTGWLGIALFGTMLAFSVAHVFQLTHDLKNRVSVRGAWSFKKGYMAIGTFVVSILLGLGGEQVLGAMAGFWPRFAIWFSTFVTTAALYPFRGELKADFPNFGFWAIYAGACGVISVVFAQVASWLT